MAGSSGNLLGQAYIRVRMDTSLLSEGLSTVRSMVLGSMGEIAAVATGMLAAAGIQSFTRQLGGLAEQFISTNDQLQQYTVSLGVLFKSEEKALDIIAQIQDMAAKTPFRFDNLTQAVVQLKTFGFEANELMPTMRAIGDAAAASPRGMVDGVQRISYALGQMKSNGKIMAHELRELAMAGIPAWDILAKKTKTSVEEIRHMSRKGELSAKEFLPMLIAGMNERFGGMMVRQSRTWSGLMSTFKDNTQFALRDIGKSFFTASSGRLANIVDWMDTKKAKAFYGEVTKIVEKMAASIPRPFAPRSCLPWFLIPLPKPSLACLGKSNMPQMVMAKK